MRPPFPFIVGCGRSGTTLLRLMLDAHPELAIPSESYFPLRADAAWRHPDGGVDVSLFRWAIEPTEWFQRWRVAPERLDEAFNEHTRLRYAEAVRRSFAAYAAERGKPRFGNKTPIHVVRLDRLARMFPEAVFVHIVRDGRDVAASFLEVPFGPDRLDEAAVFWRNRVERGRASGRRIGPRRYREVSYEALVGDPERELRALAPFCGLDFDPAMLRSHERATPDRWYHRRLTEPPSRGRDWRRQMSPDDVTAFEVLAGPSLRRLGYERGARLGPVSAARSRVVDARFRISLSRQMAKRGAPNVRATTEVPS